jgi:hypothetical protein
MLRFGICCSHWAGPQGKFTMMCVVSILSGKVRTKLLLHAYLDISSAFSGHRQIREHGSQLHCSLAQQVSVLRLTVTPYTTPLLPHFPANFSHGTTHGRQEEHKREGGPAGPWQVYTSNT